MLKTLALTLAAATLATPALAETFEHAGATYEYTVQQQGKARIISGKDLKTGQIFELTVRNRWIEGTVDGRSVSFSTRDLVRVRPATTSTEVAAR